MKLKHDQYFCYKSHHNESLKKVILTICRNTFKTSAAKRGLGLAANVSVFCLARAICATFPRSPSALYFCLITAANFGIVLVVKRVRLGNCFVMQIFILKINEITYTD